MPDPSIEIGVKNTILRRKKNFKYKKKFNFMSTREILLIRGRSSGTYTWYGTDEAGIRQNPELNEQKNLMTINYNKCGETELYGNKEIYDQ